MPPPSAGTKNKSASTSKEKKKKNKVIPCNEILFEILLRLSAQLLRPSNQLDGSLTKSVLCLSE